MAELKMEIIMKAMDYVTAPMRGIQGQIKSTSKALSQQRKELRLLENNLKKAGDGEFTNSQRLAEQQIEKTTRAIAKQEAKLKRLNQIQGYRTKGDAMMKQGAKTMAIAAGMGYMGLKSVSAFAANESAEMDLKTAMMRADGSVPAEFEKINQLANELGNSLPGTTADMQLMMRELVNQGITFESILGGTGKAAAYMAVQMKMPFDEAASFAAKMLDATQSTEAEMMGLMDTIQKGMHLGLSSSEMLEAVSKAAPALSTLNKVGKAAADEMMPLIVMAGQNELTGGSAGNAYRKILDRAIDQGRISATKKELKAMKVKLNFDFTDGKGSFGGTEKMFNELKKLEKLTDQQRNSFLKTLFGDNAETQQMINIMIAKGYEGYLDTVQKMETQASLQARVEQQLGTLTNLWDAAGGSWSNLMALWGGQLAPELKEVVKWLTDITEKTFMWTKANPSMAYGIARVTAGAVLLTASVGALTFAWGLFSKMVLGHPVIAVLALMGTLAWQVYQNWDKVVWFFNEGMYTIKNDIGDLISSIPGIGNKLRLIWDIAAGTFGAFFNGLTAIWGMVQFVISLFTDWDNAVLQVKNAWDDFTANFYRFWEGISSWLQPKIDAVMNVIQPLINGLSWMMGDTSSSSVYADTMAMERGIHPDQLSKNTVQPAGSTHNSNNITQHITVVAKTEVSPEALSKRIADESAARMNKFFGGPSALLGDTH